MDPQQGTQPAGVSKQRALTMMTPLPMRAPAMARVTGACRAAMDPSDTAAMARLMGCCKLVRMMPLSACPMDCCRVRLLDIAAHAD